MPVFKDGTQVGKATSSTWSPTLKKMIALATVKRESTNIGTQLQFEITIEAWEASRGSHGGYDSFFQSEA